MEKMATAMIGGDIPEYFHALLDHLDAMLAVRCAASRGDTVLHVAVHLTSRVVRVCQEPSPAATPYAGQYRVIEILRKLLTTSLPPLPAFEAAGKFFFPDLVQYATELNRATETKHSRDYVQSVLRDLPRVRPDDAMQEYNIELIDLLNQTGILWSNRTQPLRALCYFHAAAEYCKFLKQQQRDVVAQATADAADVVYDPELQSLQAHAHFYLAQVFGVLGFVVESAHFCLSTLEAQLTAACAGGDTATSAFNGADEWIKNCLRLIEYYIETESPVDAASALLACEFMYLTYSSELAAEDKDEHTRILAELYTAWAALHHLSLQHAQWRREGIPIKPVSPAQSRLLSCSSIQRTLEKHGFTTSTLGMTYVPPTTINDFDRARDVFKMGLSAIEHAKAYFALDGFVTQHIRLSQKASLLYKRLLHFETDRKRVIAMELRRLALLTPFLDQLNRTAFGALLQELYYESAEISADVYDMKQQLKGKLDDKTTSYALKAIQWYQQFLVLFYPPGSPAAIKLANTTDSVKALDLPSKDMAPNELKTMHLGLFSLARMCGKIVFPQDRTKTVALWTKSLEYHSLVLHLAKLYEELPNNEAQFRAFDQAFHAELGLCAEMIELMPEKINQLFYNGKFL
ncbi:TPA: hypothetical protein N0F65_004069 [Lagenidium giganteum]|uniref:KIF-binding protein n=1 Tax=Lagenidium giganteum TaxID=4803 RepID=A0AAV2YYG4_9STRA|nr:TPA: hypothetical protein N0F65_004069 [Lagenidium giganteum]